MSKPLHILERARADVDEIFNWLVRRSVSGAISWYLAFGRAIDRIGAAPESLAQAPESLRLNRDLRQTFFKTRRGRQYRIVFQLADAAVLILRIRGPGQAPLRHRDLPKE